MPAELTNHTAAARLSEAIACLSGAPPAGIDGRGIVMCGGGVTYFTNAWVSINMLRRMGCQLPIELWHLGAREMSDTARRLVEPLGVRCVDAHEVRARRPARILNGWEVKPYAIIHSAFAEVLSLDADNVPVVDPTFLFDTDEYRARGAIFWPDFGRLSRQRHIWRLTGVEYRDEPEFESGQIVVDKRRAWRALGLTMWMNEHSDFWYRHIHGDKETFHLAWRKLEQPYAMPQRGIHRLHGTMCQHDFSGRRIFQHRNMAKWSLDTNTRVAGFEYEDECRAFVDSLRPHRQALRGIAAFDAAGREPHALAAAERLTAAPYMYERVGYDARRMAFVGDGTIGEGRAGLETHWNLRDTRDGLVLEIQSATELTCRLQIGGDGVWRGRWERFERMPIELRPAAANGAPKATSLPKTASLPFTPPAGVIGVTIGVGDRFLAYATRAAASVQRYLGIPTAILSRAPNGVSPKLLKLRLFDHFDGTVFFFDADTVVLRSWDLTPYVGIPELVCVRDIANAGVDADCRELNLDRTRYFNSGVMVLNKQHHRRVLETAAGYTVRTRFVDQTILNLACQRLDVPLRLLEARYNSVGYARGRRPGDTIVAHAAGGPDKRKFDRLFPLPG